MPGAGYWLLTLAAVGALLWSAAALYYTAPGPLLVRCGLGAMALLAPLVTGLWLDSFSRGYAVAVVVFAAVVAWFHSLVPPQVADWQPSVAALPRAELSGDRLTVRNVRNFEYRSEQDYTPRWEERT